MSEELAWAAGLFEGEGCFTISGKHRQPQVKLRSTDQDVIKRFHDAVGLGTIRFDEYGNKRYGWKVQWEWYLRVSEVVEFIDLILPWLCTRRTARAMEVREVAAAKTKD